MMSLVKSESPWKWAQSRRRVFTNPWKDALSSLVLGGLGGWYRYEEGDSNWRIAVAVSGITVVMAFVLPQLETLFWFAVRKWVLFDESRLKVAELEARIADLESRLAAATTGADAGLSAETLRHHLGNVRLSYIQLEREFLARNGTKELWHQQTRLHNTALEIIDHQLGRDYWADFKDAKASLPESVIPKSFPRDDPGVMNLLYMIHGRSEWIGKIVEGIRSGAVVPKPLPLQTTAAESQRLADIRRILTEAATYMREMPLDGDPFDERMRTGWVAQRVVPELLDRAFDISPTQDYRAYIRSEQAKGGNGFDFRRAAADFLERLAGRIVEGDLDVGFVMPRTWLQFRETDPPQKWPANTR